MNAMVALAALSSFGVFFFLAALALYLRAIGRQLEEIGGPATRFYKPTNYLSKIRLGLRAIEMETGGLGPEVTKLNGGLTAVRDGLRAIDRNLAGLLDAVGKQEAKP